MNYGLDLLGIARYGKVAVEEFPDGWALGAFTYVDGFGDALPAVRDVLATNRVKICRLQLMWRDKHDFNFRRDKDFVRKEAKRFYSLINSNKAVKWYISPCCEHELNDRQFEEFAEVVRQELQGLKYEIVNSPNHRKGHVSKKYLNEYHGADKRPRGGRYAFSFDGTNCCDSNVEEFKRNYKDAEYFMFWAPQCNGRLKTEDKTPRAKRRAYPTSRQIDSWIYLSTARGATKLPKDWLLKSHGDQHTVPPSGKDQKPVFIIPQKVKEIVFKTRNGQTIDKAKYFGKFVGGGYRYYSTDFGFLLSEKARRIQGDALVDIFVNNKKVGVCNLAFRDGKYR